MDARRPGATGADFGRAWGGRDLPARAGPDAGALEELPSRSDVATDVKVFTPPFLGSRVAKGIVLDEIAAYVNETALFRNQWQFRPEKHDGRPEPDAEFKARIRP